MESYCTGCGEDGVVNREGNCILHERSGDDRGLELAPGMAGWVAASPNPDGAVGIFGSGAGGQGHQPGRLPAESANTAAVLVHYLTFGELPAVDQYNRPLFAYGRIIHDQCERRAHYDAGTLHTGVGRRRPSQGVVPLQDGVQRPASKRSNCPSVRIQRRHELAGEGRARLRRLRWIQLLGDQVSVLTKRLPNVSGIRGRRERREDRHRDYGSCSGERLSFMESPARFETACGHTRARETIRAGRGGAYGTHRSRSSDLALKAILRIEAEVNGGAVTDAWSSGTMFRGIELILRGRDPREAWIWTQRICGVCTTVHALTSVRAVEDALGIEVPANADLIRNIIGASPIRAGSRDPLLPPCNALDWVDVTLALKADPGKRRNWRSRFFAVAEV